MAICHSESSATPIPAFERILLLDLEKRIFFIHIAIVGTNMRVKLWINKILYSIILLNIKSTKSIINTC